MASFSFNFMPYSGSSALHGVNPNFKKCAVMYPEIFWGDFLWGFQQGVWGEWGTVMPPYGSMQSSGWDQVAKLLETPRI